MKILLLALLVVLPAAGAERRFTGEPISINVKDLDLRDFMRLVHEISGLNIVVEPSVRGTVTLALVNVPWDQVLDVVLRNNALVAELDGTVLRVITRAAARREHEEKAALEEARRLAGPLRTTILRLSYARANEMAPIVRKFLSPRGEVLVDERTNSLIITDIR